MKRSQSNFRGKTARIPAIFINRISGLDIISKLEHAAQSRTQLSATICAGRHNPNHTAPFIDLRATGIAPVLKIDPATPAKLSISDPHWPPSTPEYRSLVDLGLLEGLSQNHAVQTKTGKLHLKGALNSGGTVKCQNLPIEANDAMHDSFVRQVQMCSKYASERPDINESFDH